MAFEKTKTQLSEDAEILLEKRIYKLDYKGWPAEDFDGVARRVVTIAVKAEKIFKTNDSELKKLEEGFFELLTSLTFLPNSPALMNAGTDCHDSKGGQLSACFVLPIEDNTNSIMDTLNETALIHQTGAGTGFSFSSLRPKGDKIEAKGAVASGPVPFIEMFSATTKAFTKSGFKRSGANMGALRVDHPDIEEFIKAKDDLSSQRLTNFNLSVLITDKFMKALEEEKPFALINPRTNKAVKDIDPNWLLDLIAQSAWNTGEPGVIFIDKMNEHNPTPDLGDFKTTNPCGEQPLLDFESCTLGSINLTKILNDNSEIDYGKLKNIVALAVRFLDDLVEVTHFPTEKIKEATLKTRKIGLGVMGLHDMFIMMGLRYGSAQSIETAETLMEFINNEAHKTSRELALVRGSFPGHSKSVYDKPMRNATVTTIAPTGTLSIIAGVTPSIEPIMELAYKKKTLGDVEVEDLVGIFKEAAVREGFYNQGLIDFLINGGTLKDYALPVPEKILNLFVTADQIDIDAHLDIQQAFQKHCDSAISKTIMLGSEKTPWDVKTAIIMAGNMGLKGLTFYQNKSRDIEKTKG